MCLWLLVQWSQTRWVGQFRWELCVDRTLLTAPEFRLRTHCMLEMKGPWKQDAELCNNGVSISESLATCSVCDQSTSHDCFLTEIFPLCSPRRQSSMRGSSPVRGGSPDESSWDRMILVRGESPATVGKHLYLFVFIARFLICTLWRYCYYYKILSNRHLKLSRPK